MSYADIEASIEDGAPIRLYTFKLASQTWRYNSSDRQLVTVDGSVWLPAAIEDDGVKQTGESESDILSITAQYELAPVQLFRLAPPSAAMQVIVSEKHVGDDEVYVQYVGEVAQVKDAELGRATITCETVAETMKREGLRMVWQRSCPHMVYDNNCKLNAALHTVTTSVVAVHADYIELASMPSGNAGFAGGFMQWSHPVKGVERMAIESQTDGNVVPFGLVTAFHEGMTITLYKGCNQTPAACQAFGNYENYGGVPSLPGKSPFDGIASPFF